MCGAILMFYNDRMCQRITSYQCRIAPCSVASLPLSRAGDTLQPYDATAYYISPEEKY